MKTFFIRTYGCQMNELDSQAMAGILKKRGLTPVNNEEKADIIIFNTCSVRDLAERKVLGKIGILARKKRKKIIGIAGCMAMLKKDSLLTKFSNIDFVLGTNNIADLNNILDSVIEKKMKIIKTDSYNTFFDYSQAHRPSQIKAYVSIIRGCNNFCSYCIVPFARGKEVSKDPEIIIKECIHLRDQGYKELILLGQNVNSYGKDHPQWKITFSDLLYRLDKIKGIKRIRFLTSHPKDITKNLIYAIRDLPSVCEFIHFPIQSGSNRILQKMNRKYTKEQYLEKIDLLKEVIPNVTFGTDIIIGFPTETTNDFLQTYDLFKKVHFSTAFIYAYSPRKNTLAATLKDDVSPKEKDKRLQMLLKLYHDLLTEDSTQLLGSSFEVLVERFNKDKTQLKGKTRCFKKVIFEGNKNIIGTMQQVKLEKYNHQTFIGSI